MSHESAWMPLSVHASSQVVSPRNKHLINLLRAEGKWGKSSKNTSSSYCTTCCAQKENGASHRKHKLGGRDVSYCLMRIQASPGCIHGGAALRLRCHHGAPLVVARCGRTKTKKACAQESSGCEGSSDLCESQPQLRRDKKTMPRSVSTASEDGDLHLRHPKKVPRPATSSLLALRASRAASNVACAGKASLDACLRCNKWTCTNKHRREKTIGLGEG